jgi:hypothetical protein
MLFNSGRNTSEEEEKTLLRLISDQGGTILIKLSMLHLSLMIANSLMQQRSKPSNLKSTMR